MKKVFITLMVIVTIYSVYYDLKSGTLPTNTQAATTSEQTDTQIPFETVVVEPGYTVLSVVEELHVGPLNVSIQQIIVDFETLNPGTSASNIQIGKAYAFPIYFN